MPIKVTATAANGELWPTPFIGRIDHTVAIRIDISGLTSREVDAYGWLKPGVLFRKDGTLAGAPAAYKEAFINGGAAGNLTVTGIATADQLLEVTYFTISGGNVTAVSDLTAEFTVTAANTINNTGGTATTGGRLRVRYLDVSVQDYIYGAVVEQTKIHTNNTTLAAVTADVDVTVAVAGFINRAILEDSLGSALTGAEEAALINGGCHLIMT